MKCVICDDKGIIFYNGNYYCGSCFRSKKGISAKPKTERVLSEEQLSELKDLIKK